MTIATAGELKQALSGCCTGAMASWLARRPESDDAAAAWDECPLGKALAFTLTCREVSRSLEPRALRALACDWVSVALETAWRPWAARNDPSSLLVPFRALEVARGLDDATPDGALEAARDSVVAIRGELEALVAAFPETDEFYDDRDELERVDGALQILSSSLERDAAHAARWSTLPLYWLDDAPMADLVHRHFPWSMVERALRQLPRKR